MKDLVTGGHLYIAQPPLYKVKTRKGRKEQYLKDDAALDEFLVGQALRSTVIALAEGEELEGAALRPRIEQARRYVARLDGLRRRLVPEVLDAWFATRGHHVDFTSEDAVRAAADALQAALAEIAPDLHITDVALVLDDEQFAVEVRTLRDGEERVTRLRAGEPGEGLRRLADELHESLPLPVQLGGVGGEEYPSWRTLLDSIFKGARKGFEIQRYKGLGEMNPDQLWETTMDPERRSLVQVQVSEPGTADHIFSVLMGDAVDPRRNFIQQNALNVRNLDV